ncbi:restriction endonuclease [Paenibacillus turpanensis]|uniref:restriction endonuclease n=1 Tax=Paenibacillus turpanensis TaxID=2689078 RepID=UPI00140E3033|nr:restriction endonuclease [Paenibacillus turpanensis]
MARTYYAEGRQVAYLIRGGLILIGLSVFFFTGLKKYWWLFFIIIFGSVIVGDILGARWTRKRRLEKKGGLKKQKNDAPAVVKDKKSNPSISKALSDRELLKANVHTLSGTDFERLMELYYIDQGYQVQRVGGAGDHEVDLILKGKEGYKIAVQCKRWKQDVGNDIVLRLKSGKQVHGCYDAWIVTTSNFTKSAKEAAEKLNIRLINGLILDDRLMKWKSKKGIS